MKTGKLVSIVLTLAMLLSVLPMSAMAWGGEGLIKDQTAEIKVSFGESGASGTITLTTKTDNSATLKVADLADSYSGMALTAKRWYEKDENDSPTLNYESKYDDVSGTLPSTPIYNIFEFGTVDHTGDHNSLGPKKDNTASITVTVTDTEENDSSCSASYTLNGSTITSNGKTSAGTLSATTTDQTGSQSAWNLFSAETHFSINDYETDQDSYAILPVGSKIVAGPESMTVIKKLKLDDLGNVDGLAEAYQDCVTYKYDDSDDDSGNEETTSVEVLLKAGAQLIVGTREVQLLKDLTITLTGGDGFSLGNGFDLGSVDNELENNVVSGNIVANAILNGVVIPILQSIEGKTAEDDVTLTFTFGTPTVTPETISDAEEGIDYTTSGDITLGDPTSTADSGQSVTIDSGSTVKVGATTETTNSNATTTTTTKVDEYIVTTSGTETTPTTTYVYEITETTTTTGTDTETIETKTAITTTVDTTTVKNTTDSASASDTPSDYVNVAKVLTAAVADTTNSISNVKSITEMEISLKKTKQESTESLDDVIKAAVSTAQAESKTATVYEVHPVATIKTTSNTNGTPYTVTNEQIVEDAQFTFTLNFGAENVGKTVTLTHYANDGTIKLHGDKYSWDETIDSEGNVIVTLNSFSYVLGVLATSTSSGTRVAKMQGSFSDSFTLRLLVTTDLTNVTADSFSLYRAYDDLTLERVTDRTAYNNAIQSVFAVEYLAKNAYSEFGGTLYSGNTIGYKNALGDGWLITIKVFGPYLNTPLTLSMKDSNNNSVTITDYSYTDNASNTYGNSGTNQYTFLDYLKVMNAYYGTNGTYDESKSEIYSNLCNGIQTFEAGSSTFRSSTATN